MKTKLTFLSACFIGLGLVGCGSESGHPKPGLVALEKQGELRVGNTVSANSRCNDCEQIQYTWMLDMNRNGIWGDSVFVDGQLVSDKEIQGQRYTLSSDEYGVKARLEMQYQVEGKAKSDFVIYQPVLVEKIFSNNFGDVAFLKSNGELVTWAYGQIDTHDGIEKVFESDYGLAAQDTTGKLITWQRSAMPSDMAPIYHAKSFHSNQGGGFAVIQGDGSVVTWGDHYSGGDSADVQTQLVDVESIYGAKYAFAALKNDKTVVAWGGGDAGDSNQVQADLTDVEMIIENERSFAVIKADNTVVTWGELNYGGYTKSFRDELENILNVFSNRTHFPDTYDNGTDFIAIKKDGAVISWGADTYSDLRDVRRQSIPGAKEIFSTWGAYVALTESGNVKVWGSERLGGNSTSVSHQLTQIKTIVPNANAFTALKEDGSVVSWGFDNCGGTNNATAGITDIVQVEATTCAFAAVRADGSLVAWGDQFGGGDLSSATGALSRTILLKAAEDKFLALQQDGTVAAWGLDVVNDAEAWQLLQAYLEPRDEEIESSIWSVFL
ncbi:RCC1 domain-containing protein [Photobacterium galatheae]|uniref:Lipoprotein n=1 Tax=Photobacterium galatheae TaxID=1654360 RepID=A0A066S0Q9_9GAMM|nr:hypothetical protein [Photobacterium galatheae]KDM93547.1 hypothetical protein EA58_00220 [Photobacterium galatheae]MCM0151371.1 hypothetical protein [Photobacterium galatheae]